METNTALIKDDTTPVEVVQDTVVLEEGVVKKFRPAKSWGPPIIHADGEGTEIRRYLAIEIEGPSKMFLEQKTVTRYNPFIGEAMEVLDKPRVWVETTARVVVKLSQPEPIEEVGDKEDLED